MVAAAAADASDELTQWRNQALTPVRIAVMQLKPWLHVQFIASNYCMQFIAYNKLNM